MQFSGKYLCIILVLHCSTGKAQSGADSLWRVFNSTAKPDTTRAKALDQLIWNGFLFNNPDTAFYFAKRMYDFAKQKKLEQYKGVALSNQGLTCYFRGMNDEALDYYRKSLVIYKKLKSTRSMASVYTYIGLVYKEYGDFDKALENYNLSLKLNAKIKNENAMATTYGNIAILYDEQASQAIGAGQKKQAFSKFNISLKNNTLAIKIYKRLGDKSNLARTYGNVGGTYTRMGKHSMATKYYRMALPLLKETGNNPGYFSVIGNMGIDFLEEKQYDSALAYLNKSLEGYRVIGDFNNLTIMTLNKGRLFKEQQKNQEALMEFMEAMRLNEITNVAVNKSETAREMYDLYKRMGNYEKAYEMHKLHIALRDSLTSESKQREITRQELKYTYEKKAVADSTRAAGKDLIAHANLKKRKTQRYALYAAFGLLLVFGLFMFNRLRVARKQRDIIRKQKAESELQKTLIESKQREVLDSIHYARRIQFALLPSAKMIERSLKGKEGREK